MEKRLPVHINIYTTRPTPVGDSHLKEALAEARKLIEASNKLIAGAK